MFVFVLEVIVFFVSMLFIVMAPATEHNVVKKRVPGPADPEARPLLPNNDIDENDGFNRRSPSIGYDSLVIAKTIFLFWLLKFCQAKKTGNFSQTKLKLSIK